MPTKSYTVITRPHSASSGEEVAATSQGCFTFHTTPWETHRTGYISVTKMMGFQEQRNLSNCLHLPAGGLRGTQEHFKVSQEPCSGGAETSFWKHFWDSLAGKPLSEEHVLMPPGMASHWGMGGGLCATRLLHPTKTSILSPSAPRSEPMLRLQKLVGMGWVILPLSLPRPGLTLA